MFGKPKSMPSQADALPGRADRMPVPEAHFVNRIENAKRPETRAKWVEKAVRSLLRGEKFPS